MPDAAVRDGVGAPATGVGDFFRPRSIAVVGATERRGLGRDLVRTLDAQGFAGSTWYVNPNRTEVFGKPCHPSVGALPETPDLAMLMVDRDVTLSAIEECRAAGIRNVVVCSAGFSELDNKGRDLEAQITAKARDSGMRILGPNAIGFYNVTDGVPAIAIPPASIPDVLRAGNISILSQSAGLMISTMELGARLGLGFRLLASTGNTVDLGIAESIRWLADDEDTLVIALVLEGIDDGRELLDAVALAQAAGKVVVALFLGMSDRGRAAVVTHTASIAPAPEVLSAAVESAGIVRVETIAELVDRAAILSRHPRPTAGDLAIITISGGTKVLAADVSAREGVRLADLGEATLARLATIIPSIGTAGNPLDVTAAAIEDPVVMRDAVGALAEDRSVGQIALIMHLRRSGGSEAHQRLVHAFVDSAASVTKPLVVISSIPEGVGGHWLSVAMGPVPILNDIRSLAAVGALQRPVATPRATAGPSAPPIEIPPLPASGTIAEVDCYPLIEAAGITVAAYAEVSTADAALERAPGVGYPLALKHQSPAIPHRDQNGLLALGIDSDASLRAAFETIEERARILGDRSGRYIIQRQIERSPELIVGTHLDATFGPVIVVGSGGSLAEGSGDTQLRLAPIEVDEARATLARLRSVRRWRGTKQVSERALEAAAEVVSRISRIASQHADRITGLEINPLLLAGDSAVAVDALATVVEVPQTGTAKES
jgi:acyl-CoA synthetase (NDP forming)